MEPIHVSYNDLGIVSFRPAEINGYRISPERNLGRGGFRFTFRTFRPTNPELEFIEVDGSYSHQTWPFKSTIKISLTLRTKKLYFSLIRHSNINQEFNTDAIPEAVYEHLKTMISFIEETPDPSNKFYYGDNGCYTKSSGDYHYSVGENSWK